MSHADPGDIREGVTDRSQWWHNGRLANATNSVRVIGVWYLKNLCVDER